MLNYFVLNNKKFELFITLNENVVFRCFLIEPNAEKDLIFSKKN
jgi:hypothetical protein